MRSDGGRKISLKEVVSRLNLSRSWVLLFLFLVAVLIFTIVFEIFYFKELIAYLRIRRSGVSAPGRIENIRVVEDDEGPDSFYVEYAFNHNEQVYYNEHRVDGETYRSLKNGGDFEIRYLALDPDVSRIGGQIHPDFLFFTVILIIACIPYQAYSIHLAGSTVRNVRRFFIESKELGELGPNVK